MDEGMSSVKEIFEQMQQHNAIVSFLYRLSALKNLEEKEIYSYGLNFASDGWNPSTC